jgi:hypothetical protein
MKTSRKIRAGLKEIEKERTERRGVAFERAKNASERYAKQSGSYMPGRDENGVTVDTKNTSALGIFTDNWFVRLRFKKEDCKRFDRSRWTEAEASIKQGEVPTKPVTFNTHIITAVRALKHVRQNYPIELSDTDAVLKKLDRLNLIIADKPKEHSDGDLGEAIEALRDIGGEMEQKDSVVKRIVAVARIEKAVSMIEEAKAMPIGNDRDMQVSRVCAMMVSIRNRLGTWRENQIAGKTAYTFQKESALRVERDRWLYSTLTKYVEDIRSTHSYWKADLDKVVVITAIRQMLADKEPKGQMLEIMVRNNETFRVSERQRLSVADRKSFMETGFVPGGKKGVDYLMTYYELLYLAVSHDMVDDAFKTLHHLKLFVRANKPDFILEELSDLPDPYLASTIESMEKGVCALRSNQLGEAKAHFESARQKLGEFVAPGPKI